MRLDDIEHETAPRVEEWFSKIKVIRAIAHKIIDFLAQLEGFQKKLWLKKKFVVETFYCVHPRRLHSRTSSLQRSLANRRSARRVGRSAAASTTIEGDLARGSVTRDPLTTGVRPTHTPRSWWTRGTSLRGLPSRFVDALLATDSK